MKHGERFDGSLRSIRSLEDNIQSLQSTIEKKDEEIERLKDALDHIANPVKWTTNNLPPGHVIDGAGLVDVLERPSYYQAIARDALKEQSNDNG